MVKLNFFEGNVGAKKNTATQKDFTTDNNLKGKCCMHLPISFILRLYCGDIVHILHQFFIDGVLNFRLSQ